MSITDVIQAIRAAGFQVEAEGDSIAIEPFDELSEKQVGWLKANKPAILDALRSPGAILDAGQGGNDLEPANDRFLIHVPELKLSTGQRISCDMSVPKVNLEKLRAVVKFRLKGNGGGGSVLGSPGTPREELVADLRTRYGSRLETIDGAAP